MKHGRVRLSSPPSLLLLATVMPLLLLNSGCFIFGGRAKPVPPTVVINQPIVLAAPSVTQPNPPPPPMPATPTVIIPAGANAAKHRQPVVRRHPRENNHSSRHPATVNRSGPDAPARASNGNLPLLTPGLSPAEEHAYRAATVQFLNQARQDLSVLNGRNLSADQVATRTQASEFVRQAQIALNQGDVVRAQNLARKATVLTHALFEQTQ